MTRADEAVDEVVRREPEEAFVPDAPDLLASFEGESDRQQAGVDREVRRARGETRSDGHELGEAAFEAEREDGCRHERRERQRADVEEHLVDRTAVGAPLDRADGDRDRECAPRAEERSACERTDGADGDRAVVELERERLPHADERDHGEQADDVGRGAQEDAHHAGRDARDRHEADQQPQTGRKLQEARSARGVGRVTALQLRHGFRNPRQWLVVVALLRDRDERNAAVGGHQERLGARAEDAVASLQLGAVHSEIRLVDERVRILCVLREAGDTDRDGRADRLARGLDVEQSLGDRAPDPLRDLERLLGRRLRQQNREFLAAEACGHVVVAQLGAEDLRDALQHRISRQVAVGVVDLAQQVEVGHDQRQRPLEALRSTELLRQRRREVARVEEAGLGVDARFGLELRHRERPVDQEERGDREGNEPRVPGPERGEHHTECREDELRRQRLVREDHAHRMPVDEADHRGEQR